jgi:hypothetical protein
MTKQLIVNALLFISGHQRSAVARLTGKKTGTCQFGAKNSEPD